MQTVSRRRALGGLVALSLVACKGRSTDAPRCALCGMRVAADSRFRAGATKDGRAVLFDAPRCLFQYRATPAGRGITDPWVIEYYGPGDRQTPANSVRFVRGSDVRGPMGADVVPVAEPSVERFRRDHGGQPALAFEDVTSEVIRGL